MYFMRAAALLLLIATVAGAQFKSTATLVVAPTTVTDSKGKYIDAMDPEDLVLYDNGVRQPIQVDESFNPISLVVAVQTSANSAAILDKLGSSGILFTDLLAGDRGETALVTFSDEVRTLRDFTTNSDNLSAGLRSLHVQGDGAVALEAVMQSLAMLAKRKSDRRRILLVIGEKRDRSSKVKFADVLHEAQRQNVLIYWLTYSPFLEPFTAGAEDGEEQGSPQRRHSRCRPTWLPATCSASSPNSPTRASPTTPCNLPAPPAGAPSDSSSRKRWKRRSRPIASEVHRQYIVSFTPPPAKAGQYHTIRIEVKDHPELTARTRAGYWSMP